MASNEPSGLRNLVPFTRRRFDAQRELESDILRVYNKLKESSGGDDTHALRVVFAMRTAIELHRAWHLTLLTNDILQRLNDRFQLHMTWNLGVIHLIFRFEDGLYELHRIVPYDYDSEFQDTYKKIASALIEGHINVHEALIFQKETKKGKHTAKSGWCLLRNYPGRICLYPFEASFCAVIFFGGDWTDAGVAALTGLATGIVEYVLSTVIGGGAKVLIDISAGLATGIIASLWYNLVDPVCLSAIFLGTLYWFFYGTAFVIGILEIVSGELDTGVKRFIAVAVKTFLLNLGASFGMLIVINNPSIVWIEQERNECGRIDLGEQWWRIPLYLAASAAALAQYRVPILDWPRGLTIQLVGYEIQWQLFAYFNRTFNFDQDYLDTAAANTVAMAVSVISACALSFLVDKVNKAYHDNLLYPMHEIDSISKLFFKLGKCVTYVGYSLRIGRHSDFEKLVISKDLKRQYEELHNPGHERKSMGLTQHEEDVMIEAMVLAEDVNTWSILMPALYQLVPGSIIARLWFDVIFPNIDQAGWCGSSINDIIETCEAIESDPICLFQSSCRAPTCFDDSHCGTGESCIFDTNCSAPQPDIFSNLMVISTSLALGCILGSAVVELFNITLRKCIHRNDSEKSDTPESSNETVTASRPGLMASGASFRIFSPEMTDGAPVAASMGANRNMSGIMEEDDDNSTINPSLRRRKRESKESEEIIEA